MGDIKNHLQLMAALQEKDSAVDALRAKAAAIPALIAQKKDQLAAAKAAYEDGKKSLQQLQIERKQKEMDLAARENDIKKHSTELNSVKTNDAYKALLAEIEGAKQAKSDMESAILELMEKADTEAARIKEAEKGVKQQESGIQADIVVLEKELQGLQAAIDAGAADRAAFAAQIPATALQKYEYIRESRDGVAVAAIDGEYCGVCRTALRPQLINEVCKEQDYISCDTCLRILYKK